MCSKPHTHSYTSVFVSEIRHVYDVYIPNHTHDVYDRVYAEREAIWKPSASVTTHSPVQRRSLMPRLLDLCCGNEGGWAKGFLAAGWDVTGVDIEDCPVYPGHFIKADVRLWRPPRYQSPQVRPKPSWV